MSTLASSHLTMLYGYKLHCHPSKQCVIYTFNQYLVNSGGQSAIKKTTTLHLLFNFFLYQNVNMQMNFYLVKSVTFLTIIARHQSMYIFL